MNSPSSEFPLWRLLALEPDKLTAIERALLRTALFVVFFVIGWTYLDNRNSAGNDLRNRVVGARAMLAGYDPYTFDWQPGLPEELLDPIYEPKAHRLTASPPTLLLYAVTAPVPYRIQRFLWFVAEWLALIASLIMLARSLPAMRQRVVFLLGATLFVIATDVWRLHLERGQIYVFQLLALSAAIAWSRRGQDDTIAAGIALGLLALMRPNLLVLAPALLLIRQWRTSSALMVTVAAGVAITFFVLPTSSWQSYLDTGNQYYRAVEDPEPGPNDRPGHILYSNVVDGVAFSEGMPNISSSSFAYAYYLLSHRFGWPMIDLALSSKILLAMVAGLLLALLRRRGQMPGAFALAIVGALDTEFFLPHRWGYVDVVLLAPLALMLPTLLRAEPASMLALGVVLIGLVSGPFGQQFVGLHTATTLRSWLIMGGLTALAMSHVLRFRARKVAPT
jgi:Glycosyltransferase family 87